MSAKNVVMLVDNKRRDLMVATLIAYHLEQKGIRCHLENLESYRACLGAYKPDLILFNHLTAAHLVRFSERLAKMGILTAVLPNEGILYDLHVLDFNAGKHHNGAHIDLFFCWNDVHKAALEKCGFTQTQIEVVGVPRFDFYFQPWSGIFGGRKPSSGKPHILFCTNFVFAKYSDWHPSHGQNLFRQWLMIPGYTDYKGLIEVNAAARGQVFGFLNELARSGKYQVTLRSHPNEDSEVYRKWHAGLDPAQRANIVLDQDSNITELILRCDLEIACETCTTSLESWIARKPTIELALQKHPIFYHPEIAKLTATCESPKQLLPTIEQQLSAPVPADWLAGREEHLRKWCNSPDGTSSLKMAEVIAERLAKTPSPKWSELKLVDRRRALKLKMMKRLGHAYHFDPLLPVKKRLVKDKYAAKVFNYGKSMRPADVRQARRVLEKGLKVSEAEKMASRT